MHNSYPEPDPNPRSQSSWGQVSPSAPQQYYNAPSPYFSTSQPTVPPIPATNPSWSNPTSSSAPPSFLYALVSFPFIALSTLLWPSPANFARQKEHARWSVLFVLLGLHAAIVTALLYLWGRVPSLSRGIQNVGLGNYLQPHPLSLPLAITLALLFPALVFSIAIVLHLIAHAQQGQGGYRAQLYSTLVISTPLLLFCIAVMFLLTVIPAPGTTMLIPMVVIALFLLLYSLFLIWPALMGVQQLSARKALLCLGMFLIAIVLLVIFLFSLGDYQTGNLSSNGGRSSKKIKNKQERLCPNCGFSLAIYDQLHSTPAQACPRCNVLLR